MPTGIPKRGFRRSKRYKTQTLGDIEDRIQSEVPALLTKLENLTKSISCPNCGHIINIVDKEVAMFLIDHGIGKPRQKLEVDVTERIELSPLQIERIIERYQIAELAMQSPPKQLLPMQLLPSKDSVKSVKD